MYVGVGDTGLARTLARTERLAAAGADYLVVAAPFYYHVAEEARVVEHFVAVADRAPAPVVLYNIPQNTHLPLAPSVVGRLAEHPNVVGIKDSAGDWFAFERFLALRSDGFSVFQGRERMAAIALWSGADGVISSLANFAPRLLRDLAASVRDERPRREILALQARVGELGAVFEQGDWLAGLKATLQALGWDVGEPGAPIPPYDAEQRRVVREIVAAPELRPLADRRARRPGRRRQPFARLRRSVHERRPAPPRRTRAVRPRAAGAAPANDDEAADRDLGRRRGDAARRQPPVRRLGTRRDRGALPGPRPVGHVRARGDLPVRAAGPARRGDDVARPGAPVADRARAGHRDDRPGRRAARGVRGRDAGRGRRAGRRARTSCCRSCGCSRPGRRRLRSPSSATRAAGSSARSGRRTGRAWPAYGCG